MPPFAMRRLLRVHAFLLWMGAWTVRIVDSYNIPAAETTSIVRLDYQDDFGAVPEDDSPSTLRDNTALLSLALQYQPQHRHHHHQRQFQNNQNDSKTTFTFVLRIPANRTFYLQHGVTARRVRNVVLLVDGTLQFVRTHKETNDDPYDARPSPCILFDQCYNITITTTTRSSSSSSEGLIDGGGPAWWGVPGIGYLTTVEHRPVLLELNSTQRIVVEHIRLQDSPLYSLVLSNVEDVTVRYMSIVSRRTERDGHGWIDLTAFNTDGIDVSGHNVHVHDVTIWNQDDCIAVKDNIFGNNVSSNMLFERIHASGLGLTLGSIGGSTVRNITFRDAYLYKSYKGIYLKFRQDNWTYWHRTGLMEDVVFENIVMEEPEQWAIWIGPAQQADSRNVYAAHPCSLCWPLLPGSKCHGDPISKYRNITLRNVTIHNPKQSPGVILGDPMNVMEGVIFDSVVVTHGAPMASRDVPHPDRVEDSYVRNGRALFHTLVGVLGVLVVMICVRLWYRRTLSDRRDRHQLPTADLDDMDEEALAIQRSKHRFVEWRRILLLSMLVTVVFASAYARISFVRRKTSDTSRYYRCEGVAKGVALGATWPIPYCFDDQTDVNGHDRLRGEF